MKKQKVIQLIKAAVAKKSRLVDYALMNYWRGHDDVKIPIPEYAYDQHTHKGKQMGRGIDHFFADGSLLSNYFEQDREAEYKKSALHLMKTRPAVNFDAMKKPGKPNLFNDDIPDEEIK